MSESDSFWRSVSPDKLQGYEAEGSKFTVQYFPEKDEPNARGFCKFLRTGRNLVGEAHAFMRDDGAYVVVFHDIRRQRK